MFELDKQKFGAFVAQLRKEKGLTQKNLASKLFISDKAVSKWENAVSLPDTSLLIPLADILGVSVTELLMGERMGSESSLDNVQVESIVKTAISYSESSPDRAYKTNGKWFIIYILSILIGIIGLIVCYNFGEISDSLLTGTVLGAVFGAYFCFFIRTKLPRYYDENRIGGVMDGPFRMNVPGLTFNNSNWPYIALVGKIWSCAVTALYPILYAPMLYFFGELWLQYELYIFLFVFLGGLFIPMYFVGKKHQ